MSLLETNLIILISVITVASAILTIIALKTTREHKTH